MRGHTHLKTVKKEETPMERHLEGGGREHGGMTALPALFNDMERFMEETFRRPLMGFNMMPFRHIFRELGNWGEVSPTVDIFEEGGNVVLKAELPGMRREDISLQFEDNTLVISGEKKGEKKIEEKDYLRLERTFGGFRRSLRLPEGIDTEHATAAFKDGVLEVRIPRIEGKHAVRQIKIQ